MLLLFQCILCNSFLGLKQLQRAADVTSLQWYGLEWNWRDFEKIKNCIHVLASAEQTKESSKTRQ